MKKIYWILIVILLAAAILFAVYYNNLKHYWLPVGNPAERPL